jgi:tripartite-type tricarboxylate transporter receptor subunit TctC
MKSMKNFKKKLLVVLVFLICIGLPFIVNCQKEEVIAENDYPTENITYIIPFDPGGQTDVEARRQQNKLENILGVSIVIDYLPGGGGSVAWAQLMNTKPDGYTITGINIPHIILQPIEREEAGYSTEAIKEGVIAIFQGTPIGLAVRKDNKFGIESLKDFIEIAKENPEVITVGGSGTWTGHHVATLQLMEFADIKLTYVPYTGAAPTIAGFLGGHVTAMMANSNDLVTHKDKIIVLGFGTEQRYDALPDVPTFIEQGYNMTPSIERGVAVPPNTPQEYKKVLEDAFLQIHSSQDTINTMIEEGFLPLQKGIEESQAHIETKTEEYVNITEGLK